MPERRIKIADSNTIDLSNLNFDKFSFFNLIGSNISAKENLFDILLQQSDKKFLSPFRQVGLRDRSARKKVENLDIPLFVDYQAHNNDCSIVKYCNLEDLSEKLFTIFGSKVCLDCDSLLEDDNVSTILSRIARSTDLTSTRIFAELIENDFTYASSLINFGITQLLINSQLINLEDYLKYHEDFLDDKVSLIIDEIPIHAKSRNSRIVNAIFTAKSLKVDRIAIEYVSNNAVSTEKIHTAPYCPICKRDKINKAEYTTMLNRIKLNELSKYSINQIYLSFKMLNTETTLFQKMKTRFIRSLMTLIDFELGHLDLSRSLKNMSSGEINKLILAKISLQDYRNTILLIPDLLQGLAVEEKIRILECLLSKNRHNTILYQNNTNETLSIANAKDLSFGDTHDMNTSILPQSIVKQQSKEHLREKDLKMILLKGVSKNGLNIPQIEIPLHQITCISGPTAAGKTTLVVNVLADLLISLKNLRDNKTSINKETICEQYQIADYKFDEKTNSVVIVNEYSKLRLPDTSLGTFTGLAKEINSAFCKLNIAKINQITEADLSLKTKRFRCERCLGQGYYKNVDSDKIVCSSCLGVKFNKDINILKYKGFTYSEITTQSIIELSKLFTNYPKISSITNTLKKLNLGSLNILDEILFTNNATKQMLTFYNVSLKSETVTTLEDRLYVFDRPSIDLMNENLVVVSNLFNELKSKGATVLIVDNNLYLMQSSDFNINIAS